MGEAAEDILSGFVCQYCGEIIDEYAPGYPRSCGCDSDEDEMEDSVLKDVEKLLKSNGYEIATQRDINYGWQYRLKGGAILNIYITGKYALQGQPDEKLAKLIRKNHPFL